MQTRQLGRFGPVSALTLGGGGLGQVWGATDRGEAVATVREAVAAGITLLDLAPLYGNGEAEQVIGATFAGTLPAGVRVTTKCMLGNPPPGEVYPRLAASLDESLARMQLSRADLFILHGAIDAAAAEGATRRTSPATFQAAVVPAFDRLMAEGRIGGWGITAIGEPATLLRVLREAPPPFAAQCITNLLDSPGSIGPSAGEARPREIIGAARAAGVGVMGIRAVQAGALTVGFDRPVPEDSPEMADFRRAAPFRAVAAELGVSPAALAHRYALSMPGVGTVVLGVKNRAELRECLAAEAEGPLDAALIARIDAAVAA
ncbi:MAG: aldo/keto reductase [Chloroflexi bacterium]|nr:aldo/keto reductase [Chloroflexota bacterium]